MQTVRYQKKPRIGLHSWFAQECARRRRKWERTIAREMMERGGDAPPREEIEKFLVENAVNDRDLLDRELDKRAALTVIFFGAEVGILAIVEGALQKEVWLTGVTKAAVWFLVAVAFIVTLMPLRPPFLRAWLNRYVKRVDWTRLATSHFKRWVLYCWVGERRTPIITHYKKTQEIVVYTLGLAGVLLTAGYLGTLAL